MTSEPITRNDNDIIMDQELNLKWREVRVTPAQVKALVATDVEIVEAPGAGYAHIMLFASLTLDFNSIAYTWANSDHSLSIGGATTDSDAEAQALIESADRHSIVLRPAVDSAEASENGAIVLAAAGTGEPAAGDSDLIVRVLYATVKVDEA
jgi:hypothetical protein